MSGSPVSGSLPVAAIVRSGSTWAVERFADVVADSRDQNLAQDQQGDGRGDDEENEERGEYAGPHVAERRLAGLSLAVRA